MFTYLFGNRFGLKNIPKQKISSELELVIFAEKQNLLHAPGHQIPPTDFGTTFPRMHLKGNTIASLKTT